MLLATIYIVPMKYTPAQFRDTIGISQETLRHWRRVLPIYADRIGYSPVFTISDMVVGAIIKRLRDHLGVSVSRLAHISQQLGNACDQTSWESLECSVLFLDMENQKCAVHSQSSFPDLIGLQVILPLEPVLRQITDVLMQDDENNQRNLAFPFDGTPTNLRRDGKI